MGYDMMVPARSFKHASELKQDGYDAFMDYSGGYGGTLARRDESPTYTAATERLIETRNTSFLARELPFIPPCTSMHYPWPRARDKKTGKLSERWYHYQWPERVTWRHGSRRRLISYLPIQKPVRRRE